MRLCGSSMRDDVGVARIAENVTTYSNSLCIGSLCHNKMWA